MDPLTDRPLDRAGAYDDLYGLLVALCDHATDAPAANLMAAFNLVADAHVPAEVRVAPLRDFDQMLNEVVDLVRSLFHTSTELAEKTRLTALRLLITSVTVERGRALGRSIGQPR